MIYSWVMHLARVVIKNYRSIKGLTTLTFDPKCRILVGINESGKTNILNALNLLDPEVATTGRDLREPALHESPITEAHVRFVFRFSKQETEEIFQGLKAKILSETYATPIGKIKGTELTLEEFAASREGLYVANLITEKKYATTWSFEGELGEVWKKVGPGCPADFAISLSGSRRVLLRTFTLVDTSKFSEIPPPYLTEATLSDFSAIDTAVVAAKVKAALLKVIFWNYDESNLLPPRIDLEKFCGDPDTCLPLKRMFQLYGISAIDTAVSEAKKGSSNALGNLLRRVAEKTSKHFHSTWKEYEGIKFSVGVDGTDLVARIEDKSNHYELSQRSDGFKRFVTFLLMVSAEDASKLLKDTVLLIDEPEIGLHPTGARYLMEEL